MEKLEVTRNSQTDQFSSSSLPGNDTIRCMVTVEGGSCELGRGETPLCSLKG